MPVASASADDAAAPLTSAPAGLGPAALAIGTALLGLAAVLWALAAVRVRARRLDAVLAALPAHVAVLDRQGRILAVNEAWRAFTASNGGDERRTGVATNYLEVCRRAARHLREAAVVHDGIEAVLGGARPSFTHEYECHGDREERWFVLSVAAIDPSVGGAVVSHFDITSRKRAESQARQAAKLADAATAAKSEFLASMSHEIRTPLSGILGLTELLMNDVSHPAAREKLTLLGGAAESLLAIINDILDLAKVEAGKLTLEERPFDLRAWIEEAVSLLRPRAAAKGLNLTIALPDELRGLACGDRLRLGQILLNLLGNAVKFTTAGDVTVRCTVDRLSDDAITLTTAVEDTGPGIPPAQQELLFRPFSQLTSARPRSDGTGLGLALSKQLVSRMGGTIGCESRPGVGSRFWFTVTLSRVPAETSAPPDEPTQEPAPPGLRVLVAEDNAVNQAVARAMLERLGCQVTLVNDGSAAVEAARSTGYDLILMDCEMPRMDGYQATRAIRALAGPPGTVFIGAMTAHAMEGERQRCLEAGMNEHLPKPVRIERLRALLAEVERRRSSHHEAA